MISKVSNKSILVGFTMLIAATNVIIAQNPNATPNQTPPPPAQNQMPPQGSNPAMGGPAMQGNPAMMGNPAMGGRDMRKEEMNNRRNMYLTRRLNLSPQQSQAFFPVYQEYLNQLDQLKKDSRKELLPILGNDSLAIKMADKDKLKLADNELALKQKEMDLFKKYHEKFKALLTPVKTALLYQFEEQYVEEQSMRGGMMRPGYGPNR